MTVDELFTSTDQAGNFRIGDNLQINQSTGTISGRAFTKSLFSEMTPFILAPVRMAQLASIDLRQRQ